MKKYNLRSSLYSATNFVILGRSHLFRRSLSSPVKRRSWTGSVDFKFRATETASSNEILGRSPIQKPDGNQAAQGGVGQGGSAKRPPTGLRHTVALKVLARNPQDFLEPGLERLFLNLCLQKGWQKAPHGIFIFENMSVFSNKQFCLSQGKGALEPSICSQVVSWVAKKLS